jgi:hypothetical protein
MPHFEATSASTRLCYLAKIQFSQHFIPFSVLFSAKTAISPMIFQKKHPISLQRWGEICVVSPSGERVV